MPPPQNELILNFKKDKTEVTIFGTQSRLSKAGNNVHVEYQSTKVNVTESYNYLGVKVDPTLNFYQHFRSVYKKASTRLRLLRKIRSNLTNVAALRIYQALVLPTIMYCSLTNYFNQPYRRNLISSLEQRARIIVNVDETPFPSIDQLHKKKVCKFVRKCIDGDLDNFNNYFEMIKHNKRTRNNNSSIRLPKINLESTRKSFHFYGASLYNKLPTNIRTEENRKVFNKKLYSFKFLWVCKYVNF